MKSGKRSDALFWLVLLLWAAVFVLGGLLLSSFDLQDMVDVFQTPAAGAENGLQTQTAVPETVHLPPTWTATAAITGQDDGLPPGGLTPLPTKPASSSLPDASPTATAFITPIPFSEGPFPIGASASGQAIEAYRFGTGPVHRMIVAGIHGGYEWNTVALADELIEHLQEHPDFVPRTVTLFIVRALNPDGYERAWGVDGRVNNNGVDLNRNFPVNWQPDWDRDSCWNYAPTSSGTGPGSEPETRALSQFILLETRVTALISYHSAALGIFPGGEPPHEPSVQLAEALAAVSTYPYPPIDIGCFYTGTLPDWAAAAGIAAVDLELHNHVETDFDENLEILKVFLAWRR
jgi:hypothetical protein